MPVTDIDVIGGVVKVQTAGQDPHKEQLGNVSWGFNDTDTLSFMCERTFQIELEDLTISGVAPGTKPAAETALDGLFPNANTGTGGTGTDTASGRVSGMDLYWISGLMFGITAGKGKLNGVTYNFAGDTITLDPADVTDPRIDLIGVQINTAGTALEIFAITGDPAADPAEPTYDNITQIRISIATISANAVVPDNVTDKIMYAENLGVAGGEFDVAGTATFNKNSIVFPETGSKSIQVTGWTNGQYIEFTAGAVFNISSVEKIIIPIRLTNRLNNNRNLVISLRNGNTVVSNTIQATTKGLTRTTTGVYQTIVIDVSLFNFTNTNINKMRITMTGSGNPAISLVMDDVRFQTSLVAQVAPVQNLLISKTYAQVVALAASANLFPGQFYKITDFVTTHIIPGSAGSVVHTGDVEPLIVQALSTSTLSQFAVSETNPRDIITYSLDNDNDSAVPGSTKGMILRRVDPVNNVDLPYDWREATFRRYKPTGIALWLIGTTYASKAIVKDADGNIFISLFNSNTGNLTSDGNFWLNTGLNVDTFFVRSGGTSFDVIVFAANMASFTDYPTFFGTTKNVVSKDNTRLQDNIFRGDAISVTIDGVFSGNTFLEAVQNLVVGGDCLFNVCTHALLSMNFDDFFWSCLLGGDVGYSTISNMYANVMGDAQFNLMRNAFSYNLIGTGFHNNESNEIFQQSLIGRNFQRNKIMAAINSRSYPSETSNLSKIWMQAADGIYIQYVDDSGTPAIVLILDSAL